MQHVSGSTGSRVHARHIWLGCHGNKPYNKPQRRPRAAFQRARMKTTINMQPLFDLLPHQCTDDGLWMIQDAVQNARPQAVQPRKYPYRPRGDLRKKQMGCGSPHSAAAREPSNSTYTPPSSTHCCEPQAMRRGGVTCPASAKTLRHARADLRNSLRGGAHHDLHRAHHAHGALVDPIKRVASFTRLPNIGYAFNMAHPGSMQEREFKVPKLCQCRECTQQREAPPVTDEMRAQWAAMGLQLTKTPVKTRRQDYQGAMPDRRYGS